jgi:transcriptional regulator with XRE-family HTH domain
MNSSDTIPAASAVAQPIARNVRRWRAARDLSLSALAEQAGVAKSTVSLIERGRANPSIDTVSALASALGVPFASLFDDDAAARRVVVVRESESPVLAAAGAAAENGQAPKLRRLLTRAGGEVMEIHTVVLERGSAYESPPRASGTFEHVTVASGAVEISADVFSEVLRAGDLISFPADRPHRYRALANTTRLVSVHQHPQLAPAR